MSTADKMAAYRAAARQRQQQRSDHQHQRHQLGLTVAQQAADLLKHEFGVKKVVLFGSMLTPATIHERSDVDLAVWGLNPKDYYQAVGQLLALNPNLSVDLVEAESASPRLLQAIESTGVAL